jgi:arabinose-5-phosphate isomerase
LGIITDGDLRRMLSNSDNISGMKATDIMSMNPRRIDADELAVKALENIRNFSITQLLVVKSGKYVGIIHIHDLIREGII